MSIDLSHIKLLILDVDGTLTDGGIYITESGEEFKRFNSKDGIGIRRLQRAGVEVALLSGAKTSSILQKRAEMLYINRWYGGDVNKVKTVKKWSKEMDIPMDAMAYIGDDVNDLQAMRLIGYSACPSDSIERVKIEVDEVLTRKGGEACVREFIERHYPHLFD